MNPTKDNSILDLLVKLDIEARHWIVVEDWDADLCAVGLATKEAPRRLVYISTFDRMPGRYFYECEVPTGPDLTDYSVVDAGEDVDFETLAQVLESHLGRGSGK